MKKFLFLSLLAIFGISVVSTAVLADDEEVNTETSAPAKRGHALRGSIELESTAKITVSYKETQDNAITFLDEIHKRILALSRGESATQVTAPTDATLHFLNAAYLDCTVKSGTCRSILQALLEYEITNVRQSKKADCPTMVRFWKLWLDGDLEKRQKYMVRTAYINATSDFNRKVRPMYIKCDQTVGEELKVTPSSDSAYFRARYSKDSDPVALTTEAIEVLGEIKKNIPSVFVANGIK